MPSSQKFKNVVYYTYMPNKIYLDLTEDAEPPQWFSTEKTISFIDTVLNHLQYTNWEVSVLFCSNDFIQKLNKQYRNIDEPTDVLSFALNEAGSQFPYTTGDIIISFKALQENAKFFNETEPKECMRLLVHGLLHLAGYEHSTNNEDEPMLQLQETILEKLQAEW